MCILNKSAKRYLLTYLNKEPFQPAGDRSSLSQPSVSDLKAERTHSFFWAIAITEEVWKIYELLR